MSQSPSWSFLLVPSHGKALSNPQNVPPPLPSPGVSRRLGVEEPGGLTSLWRTMQIASLPQQKLFGSLTLQEAASSLTSSVVNSPEGHPQFSFPLTNPHMQSLCTARNSLCPRAGSTHQICVAAHRPRLLSWEGLGEFIISSPLPPGPGGGWAGPTHPLSTLAPLVEGSLSRQR